MKVKVVYLKDKCYNWGMKVGDIYDVISFEDNGRHARVNAPRSDGVILYQSEYEVVYD